MRHGHNAAIYVCHIQIIVKITFTVAIAFFIFILYIPGLWIAYTRTFIPMVELHLILAPT
jgi:hypothetical protein